MEKQGKMAIQERPVPYRRNASLYKAGRSTKKRAVANNNGKLSKTDKRLMQFLACVFIFAVVAIVKVVFPQGAAYVKQTVFGSIVDIDYKGAVEALGRALGGGGNITEVFNHFIVHEDSKADEADKSNDDNEALQPDTNSPDEKEGIDIADDASGTISGDGISDTSEANGDSTAAQNSIDPSDLESGISRTNLISRSGTNNLPTRQ